MSLLQHLRQFWPVLLALLAKLAEFELPSVQGYASAHSGQTFAAILLLVVIALAKEQPNAVKALLGKPRVSQKGFIRITEVASIFFLCAVLVFVPAVLIGCTGAQIQADVQTILNDMPTVISIVASILQIVPLFAAAPQGLASQVTTYEGKAVAALQLIKSDITVYETNLAAMPQSVIGEIDAAVATAQQSLAQIESLLNVANANVVAAIAAVAATANTFFLGLMTLIPVSALAAAPYTRHVLESVATPSGYVIPTARTLAKTYNSRVAHVAPKARVHVPWVHLGPIPVLP
jgi:hypothetical protein